MTLNNIINVYNNIHPLNFGRRILFQEYVLREIEKVESSEVFELKEKFLTDEFWYGEYMSEFEENEEKFYNLVSDLKHEEGQYNDLYKKYLKEFQTKILRIENRKEGEGDMKKKRYQSKINTFNEVISKSILVFLIYHTFKFVF